MLKEKVRTQEKVTPSKVEELPRAEERMASIIGVHGVDVDEPPVAADASTLIGATREAPLVSRRGRRKKPKPWLMSVLCRTGIHKGQWAFAIEGNCAQERECRRCGFVHVRTKHQQEWRYMREFACQQLQSCKRCNLANSDRTRHEWSESWDIDTRWWQGSKEAHRCLRCGAREEWTVDND